MKSKYAPGLAISMGAVAGLRPMTALAVLTLSLRRGWIRPVNPYVKIVSAGASKRVIEFAVSELVADKLPFTGSRLGTAQLAWRIASGAICGAVVHGTVRRPTAEGAILGGLGSLAGAVIGHHVRQRLNRDMPDLVVALLEDTVALGAGAAIVGLGVADE
jgi:uncharacterized membrane protein